jgi:hypothetical protein
LKKALKEVDAIHRIIESRVADAMMGFGQEMSWNRLGGRLRAAWSRDGFSRGRQGKGRKHGNEP